MQQQYSAMVEEINKVQQAGLVEMENRLAEHIEKRNKLMEIDMNDRKEHEKE